MPAERLQKIIARAGICSRRQAEEHIRAGRVAVDGVITTEMGTKVDPHKQKVTFDHKRVTITPKKIYILLNKPKGVVTTMSDPQGRPTVVSLLKKIDQRLFPVGRLDLDTEGALLMTNDGAMAQKIIHPRYEIDRTYQVVVKGRISKEKIEMLEKGIELEGKKTWPARIKMIEGKQKQTKLSIIIHEGKKRQVRRMFAAVGHPVTHLKRMAYGNLKVGGLAPGEYRFLNKNDLERLFSKPGRQKKLYKQKKAL